MAEKFCGDGAVRTYMLEQLQAAIRAAYEDAAKIAEGMGNWYPHKARQDIADAIRARITPRNTTPTDDHSKE
jgi:predicted unusual protein kinase regulating ubiquinone biosynthesis (AarF/ABC1/UbiB family)